MQRLKILFLLLFISSLSFSQKKKELEAEIFYEKANNILEKKVHNALSQELSNKALIYVKKAIELNPKKSKYYSLIGNTYFNLKMDDLAFNNFEKALKIDSTNCSAWIGKAIFFYKAGNYILSENNYKKALQFKDYYSIYYNLGILYGEWNKLDLALKYYDEAINRSSKFTSAYLNRGKIKLQYKMYNDAILDFDIVISLDSVNKNAFNNRGLCKFYLKDINGAITDFEKSLSINLGKSFDENYNTDEYAYNNMANAYFALGNKSKACEFWYLALQKGYKYQNEWKEQYNIDDPNELIKSNCK